MTSRHDQVTTEWAVTGLLLAFGGRTLVEWDR